MNFGAVCQNFWVLPGCGEGGKENRIWRQRLPWLILKKLLLNVGSGQGTKKGKKGRKKRKRHRLVKKEEGAEICRLVSRCLPPSASSSSAGEIPPLLGLFGDRGESGGDEIQSLSAPPRATQAGQKRTTGMKGKQRPSPREEERRGGTSEMYHIAASLPPKAFRAALFPFPPFSPRKRHHMRTVTYVHAVRTQQVSKRMTFAQYFATLSRTT